MCSLRQPSALISRVMWWARVPEEVCPTVLVLRLNGRAVHSALVMESPVASRGTKCYEENRCCELGDMIVSLEVILKMSQLRRQQLTLWITYTSLSLGLGEMRSDVKWLDRFSNRNLQPQPQPQPHHHRSRMFMMSVHSGWFLLGSRTDQELRCTFRVTSMTFVRCWCPAYTLAPCLSSSISIIKVLRRVMKMINNKDRHDQPRPYPTPETTGQCQYGWPVDLEIGHVHIYQLVWQAIITYVQDPEFLAVSMHHLSRI